MRWFCTLILTGFAFSFPALQAEEKSRLFDGTPSAEAWQQGLPLANANIGFMALSSHRAERLMLFLPTAAGAPESNKAEFIPESPVARMLSRAAEAGVQQRFSWLTAAPPADHLADIRVDFLDSHSPREYVDFHDLVQGVVSTKSSHGAYTQTSVIFPSETDDLIVIHLQTDKPGSLNFKLQLERSGQQPAADVRVEDRRVLIMHGKLSAAPDSPSFEVRAWVFPMESEVSPGEKEISVLGEGEALVLFATASGAEGSPALSGLSTRMKKYGFGGAEPPDISMLWDGLLVRQQTAWKTLMAEKK